MCTQWNTQRDIPYSVQSEGSTFVQSEIHTGIYTRAYSHNDLYLYKVKYTQGYTLQCTDRRIYICTQWNTHRDIPYSIKSTESIFVHTNQPLFPKLLVYVDRTWWWGQRTVRMIYICTQGYTLQCTVRRRMENWRGEPENKQKTMMFTVHSQQDQSL